MLWMAAVGWSLDLLQYLKRTLCLSTNIYFGKCSFLDLFQIKTCSKVLNLSELFHQQFYDLISLELKLRQFKIIALPTIEYSCCTLPILRLEDV